MALIVLPLMQFYSCFVMRGTLIIDVQRRKRALMGTFSHFQLLTFFNRYMLKVLICALFVQKLYM